MRFSVSETARLTGVSVRTLHYYDQIGLLSPGMVTETGYRYYGKEEIGRLQQILFYRELDFSLKDIMKIMCTSDYDKSEALQKQQELLRLKKDRLDRLIGLLDDLLKGEDTMSFKEFDKSDIEKAKAEYEEEVKQRWGKTDAYRQNQEKSAGYSESDWNTIMQKSEIILQKFAQHMEEDPGTDKVQELVKEWQTFITEFYYDCTNEILAGLGEMYTADERFQKNMDKFQAGTAEFMSRAIRIYCGKKR